MPSHLSNKAGIPLCFSFHRSLCTEAAMGPVREIAMKAGEETVESITSNDE